MRLIACGVVISSLALAGCATDGGGTQPTLGKTGAGAATGAILGGVLGNVLGAKGARTEATVIGAAIGAAVGGGIGYALDSQEQAFRRQLAQETAAREVEIQRVRNDMLKLIVANDVLFNFDSAVLNPGFRSSLQKIAEVMNTAPGSTIRVIGYTDSTGSETYNLQLSQRRAEAVRQGLIDYGVSPSRLIAEGRGEADPRATNATPEGRQQNRRVELIVMEQA